MAGRGMLDAMSCMLEIITDHVFTEDQLLNTYYVPERLLAVG